jgi:hypothetical protein
MLSGRPWNSGFFRLAVIAVAIVALGFVVAAADRKPELTPAQKAAAHRKLVKQRLLRTARFERAEMRKPVVRRERARLRAEQKPHFGAGEPGTATREAQAKLVADVERSITRDARSRFAAGKLDQTTHYTTCQHLVRPNVRRPPPPPVGTAEAGYECTAVTNTVPKSKRVPTVIIGFPFWARVNFRTGHYAWCKVNLLPGEHGIGDTLASVPLDPICDLVPQGPA